MNDKVSGGLLLSARTSNIIGDAYTSSRSCLNVREHHSYGHRYPDVDPGVLIHMYGYPRGVLYAQAQDIRIALPSSPVAGKPTHNRIYLQENTIASHSASTRYSLSHIDRTSCSQSTRPPYTSAGRRPAGSVAPQTYRRTTRRVHSVLRSPSSQQPGQPVHSFWHTSSQIPWGTTAGGAWGARDI
ncbi:hypothetical protein BOTBODRAFT_484235 [Botryobasidium botryosum FD-172 SS1]|uniref:Uncharacterized protein n=1 Tax=Botryobasidium botryosum (strain FD-172 SS1) TaxID=930990 RepID=A0A067MTN8_BOTB1|nr:hypothetical protein BOTBODRAFT_484235 [Botryobasidium botryosum FD-172 SS1]